MTRLAGCLTALITPFTAEGAIDEASLRALVRWQLAEGVDGLVPVGSTGEAVTLSAEERARVIAITVDEVGGRVPVIAGVGSNDTRQAIANGAAARAAGATHLLHVSPMYNKPPQRGIVAHFRAIAAETDLPIVVYNVPGRTASNIEPATALALAEIPGIVGLKEASGDLGQIAEILRRRPAHLSVLSGDDALTLGVLAHGGDGVISVVSNVTPRAMGDLVRAARAGDIAVARALHDRLAPWMRAAFVESNPIPVKAALALLGRAGNHLRLPLVPLEPAHEPVVRAALVAAGALP